MPQFKAIASASQNQIARFCADETGATAIEYAMIAAGIAAAIIASVSTLGTSVKALFDKVAAAL